MRFGWRFWIDFLRFYFTAIRLIFLLLAAEYLAIPGPKIGKIQDRPPGLKFSFEIENFNLDTQQTPIFVGNSEGRD